MQHWVPVVPDLPVDLFVNIKLELFRLKETYELCLETDLPKVFLERFFLDLRYVVLNSIELARLDAFAELLMLINDLWVPAGVVGGRLK